MQSLHWLYELRYLLALPTYEARQQALERWESRWLIELQARECLAPDVVDTGEMPVSVRYTERAFDTCGQLLWDEPYIYRRISGPGERLVRDAQNYVVLSSVETPDHVIITVLRRVPDPLGPDLVKKCAR